MFIDNVYKRVVIFEFYDHVCIRCNVPYPGGLVFQKGGMVLSTTNDETLDEKTHLYLG